MSVGAFGLPGSFSHLAAKWAYGRGVRSVPRIRDVFAGIRRGRLDVGVLPLENTHGGWVADVVLELMGLAKRDREVRITREIHLPVILRAASARAGMTVREAKRVYSHPFPLWYARKWLKQQNPQVEPIDVPSTSEAARRAARDPDGFALCNDAAAQRYGLRVIGEPARAKVPNITRFIAVSKREKPGKTPAKTSLWFSTADKPGSLADALEPFSRNGVNLTGITSQSVGSFQSYRFFVELDGASSEARVQRALTELGMRTQAHAILGSYPVETVSVRDATRLL